MLERLAGSDACAWIVTQQAAQEIASGGVEVHGQTSDSVPTATWHRGQIEPKRADARPGNIIRRSQLAANHVQLRFALLLLALRALGRLKDAGASEEFAEDATHCPEVRRFTKMPRATKKQLRRLIRPGARYEVAVVLQHAIFPARGAKVTENEAKMFIEQHVGRFEIKVSMVTRMHRVHAKQNSMHNLAYVQRSGGFLQQASEVPFEIVENEKMPPAAAPLLDGDGSALQTDHVLSATRPQCSSFLPCFREIGMLKTFEGNHLLCGAILREPHHTEAASAQFAHGIVPGTDPLQTLLPTLLPHYERATMNTEDRDIRRPKKKFNRMSAFPWNIRCLACSDDRVFLACIGDWYDQRMLVVDKKGTRISQWGHFGWKPGTLAWVRSMAVARDILFVACWDYIQLFRFNGCLLRFWTPWTMRGRKRSPGKQFALAVSESLVCALLHDTIVVFSHRGEQRFEFVPFDHEPVSLAVTHSEVYVAANTTVAVHSAVDGACLRRMRYRAPLHSIATSPTGDMIFFVLHDKLYSCRPDGQRIRKHAKFRHLAPAVHMAFSRDDLLLVSRESRLVYILEAQTQTLRRLNK